ncbi:hypothetical protein DFH09DRAFT_1306109 [Mycena vulgaris]|nr:hypothetical protein DFH09DRAFT_1306109 [Mycena vulgaris]
MSGTSSPLKVEALWFTPELVRLRAENQIFRVFSTILKAQSSVFADMFAFPQLPRPTPEVEVFLKAIFIREPELENVIGILRLSNTYEVPYLHPRSLEHLGIVFHMSLSEYDIRKDSILTGNGTFPRMVMSFKAEVGALWILPVAYYQLCTQEVSRIISDPCWRDLGEKEQTACLVGHSAQVQY